MSVQYIFKHYPTHIKLLGLLQYSYSTMWHTRERQALFVNESNIIIKKLLCNAKWKKP